jgi:hypothetical protein
MYTTCTYRLTQVMHAEPLQWIPRAFIYIALAAWAVTLMGLLHELLFAKRREGRS